MRSSRKSKLDHSSFDLSLPHGWCRRENGGGRSLLLASNALSGFAESFAGTAIVSGAPQRANQEKGDIPTVEASLLFSWEASKWL